MLGVSRWTVHRRVVEYGLDKMRGFTSLSDGELDEVIKGYIANHGKCTGYNLIAGYLKSLGLRIQRRRVRERLAKLDPQFLCHAGNTMCLGQIPFGILMDITP